jgi:hypothetical protein
VPYPLVQRKRCAAVFIRASLSSDAVPFELESVIGIEIVHSDHGNAALRTIGLHA